MKALVMKKKRSRVTPPTTQGIPWVWESSAPEPDVTGVTKPFETKSPWRSGSISNGLFVLALGVPCWNPRPSCGGLLPALSPVPLLFCSLTRSTRNSRGGSCSGSSHLSLSRSKAKIALCLLFLKFKWSLLILTTTTTKDWRRAQQPIPAFWPGESHGERSRVGYGVTQSRRWLKQFSIHHRWL